MKEAATPRAPSYVSSHLGPPPRERIGAGASRIDAGSLRVPVANRSGFRFSSESTWASGRKARIVLGRSTRGEPDARPYLGRHPQPRVGIQRGDIDGPPLPQLGDGEDRKLLGGGGKAAQLGLEHREEVERRAGTVAEADRRDPEAIVPVAGAQRITVVLEVAHHAA